MRCRYTSRLSLRLLKLLLVYSWQLQPWKSMLWKHVKCVKVHLFSQYVNAMRYHWTFIQSHWQRAEAECIYPVWFPGTSLKKNNHFCWIFLHFHQLKNSMLIPQKSSHDKHRAFSGERRKHRPVAVLCCLQCHAKCTKSSHRLFSTKFCNLCSILSTKY